MVLIRLFSGKQVINFFKLFEEVFRVNLESQYFSRLWHRKTYLDAKFQGLKNSEINFNGFLKKKKKKRGPFSNAFFRKIVGFLLASG